MASPLVSICIPTYNHERYLAEALQSVVDQTFTDFEVLVIDDCSADGTAAVARDFARRDQRISVQVNDSNRGMVPNWNHCLAQARGRYVKFLFGDDRLTVADALEKMVAAMEQSPAIVLASSARMIIDDQSHVVGTDSYFKEDFVADGRDVIRRCIRRITRDHNLIGEPSAVMFRREFAARGFDCRYRQLVDLEMWFHLLEQGRFAYLREPLCSFRRHEEQQTKFNIAELNFVDDLDYLFTDYLVKPYAGTGAVARTYLRYYQFYKLQKHARQGKHDPALVREKIRQLYGPWRFLLLRPFYRLYTPYWQLKRLFDRFLAR